MKKFLSICTCAALLFIPAAFADNGQLVRMQRAIDMRVDNGEFMGVVLVASDSQVLLNRAYGMANVAQKIPNETETRFRVCSVTKQFTAASILLLEQRGKLKLDDPIKKYMPDAPEEWRAITFRHLLTHTSGIPSINTAKESSSVTPKQLVERVRDRRLEFPPGSSYNYSSSGYIVLGYLIEKISGQSYGRFLQQNFFRPLKMWSSGYDPNLAKAGWQAQGHVPGRDGPSASRFVDMSASFASAGVYSTSADVLKWERALYSGKVLHAAQLQEMLTPYKNHYGLGVVIEEAPGGNIYSVGGGIEGFNTRVIYSPRNKLTVIVLSNVGGEAVDGLASDLRKVASLEPGPLPSDHLPVNLDAEALDRLTGPYWTEDATILQITRKDGHLVLNGAGGIRNLYPLSKRDFAAQKDELQLSFTDDAPAHNPAIVLHLQERAVHAERITQNDVRAIYEMRARKLQQQTPTPGSEAALRKLIQEIVAGNPDYSQFGPTVGGLTRRELPRLQPLLESLGDIRQIDFLGVQKAIGADVYVVSFKRGGNIQARIALGPDGKIWAQQFSSGAGTPPIGPIEESEQIAASGRR